MSQAGYSPDKRVLAIIQNEMKGTSCCDPG
jgi:hypothetical protein